MQAVPCLCQEPAAPRLPRALWKLPCSHGGCSSQRDKRQNNTCWGITSFPQGWEKPCSALGNGSDCCSLSWQGKTQSPLTSSCSKAASNTVPIAGKAEALPECLKAQAKDLSKPMRERNVLFFPSHKADKVSLKLVRGSGTKSGLLNPVYCLPAGLLSCSNSPRDTGLPQSSRASRAAPRLWICGYTTLNSLKPRPCLLCFHYFWQKSLPDLWSPSA